MSSPHISQDPQASVRQIMDQVLLALGFGIFVNLAFFGLGAGLNILIAIVFACGAEALTARWIQKKPWECLRDHSALVTAVLLALCLPPLAPWWLVAATASFAIIIGKQIYGGMGHNIFNPAMLGLVFALVSWPYEMSLWLTTAGFDFSHYLWSEQILWDKLVGLKDSDGITSATPLALMKTGLHDMLTVEETLGGRGDNHWGSRAWGWLSLAYFCGGLWLLFKKIIDWRAPAALLLSLCVLATLAYAIDPSRYPSPAFHLLSGGVVLGAFFIVTDPCSGCTTPLGKLVFGAGAGLLIFVIRTYGHYPDAVGFSVLLMNCCAPMLDSYLIPKCFAEKDS